MDHRLGVLSFLSKDVRGVIIGVFALIQRGGEQACPLHVGEPCLGVLFLVTALNVIIVIGRGR